MEGDEPAEVARDAVAALIGLSSVSATTQDGTELRVDPQSVDGLVIRALVPRLSLVGVQTVKLRWSVAGKPWVADAVLDDAEFHSTEQAIAVLRVEAAEPADLGRAAARAELHAAGLLRAVQCVNAVPGNEYQVRIDDVSETGVRISSEFAVTRNDEFVLEFDAAGTPVAPRGTGGRRAHGCRRHLRDRRTGSPASGRAICGRCAIWSPGSADVSRGRLARYRYAVTAASTANTMTANIVIRCRWSSAGIAVDGLTFDVRVVARWRESRRPR